LVDISIHSVSEIKVVRYTKWESKFLSTYFSMTLEVVSGNNERTEITFYGGHGKEQEVFDLQFEIPSKAETDSNKY